MKICLISNLYPPYQRGGAEQVVKNTAEGLLARGQEVAIITGRPLANRESRIPPHRRAGKNQERIRIYRFFPFNLFFYGSDYKYPIGWRFFWHIFDIFNIHSFFAVRQIMKKEKPDIVHTHNLKGLGYLIPAAVWSLGLFHVHTLHDVQLAEPSGVIVKGRENSFRYNGWPIKIYAALCRFLFGSPAVVISPSNFLLGFYEARGFFPRSKKVILPNPVIRCGEVIFLDDGEIASRSLPRTAIRGEGDGSFHFLYLGQVEEHKGVLFLIKVFKKLCETETRAALHIVGAGSRLEKAKRLAAGCPDIVFHGKVERERLPGIFTRTDMTVVPSLCYENSPTVIFESFSFGRPVLASSIEGVAELIKDGENGLTFVAGEENSLLEKLRFCAENIEKIRGMGSAAVKSVEGLGLEPYLDKLLDLCYNTELNKSSAETN